MILGASNPRLRQARATKGVTKMIVESLCRKLVWQNVEIIFPIMKVPPFNEAFTANSQSWSVSAEVGHPLLLPSGTWPTVTCKSGPDAGWPIP